MSMVNRGRFVEQELLCRCNFKYGYYCYKIGSYFIGMLVSYLDVQQTEAGFLNKISSLGAALGVTMDKL